MADVASGSAEGSSADKASIAKLSVQLRKITEANGKYKSLLKLAKERIQHQEDQLEALRQEKTDLEGRLQTEEKETANHIALDDINEIGADEGVPSIVRVCQRVRIPVAEGLEEIWALLELETLTNEMTDSPPKRSKQWKRFDTESELQDFIRRDTGEPLQLPPYSLAPDQSEKIQKEAASHVSAVTEDFRRFRVRSELMRKQADAQIRELQSSHVQSAALRIEGQDIQHELEQARSAGNQLEQMRVELATQEAHWKEAYETLLAENNALKSSGSEALLASQWRQRYDQCRKEKDELQSRIEMELKKADTSDAGKYEMKYRDLKESFRLYRKKAKEIFEAQQQGVDAPYSMIGLSDSGSADSKLSYLRNLMVNYLTADQAMKDHMESAIGTVLQFTQDEVSRIEKKRAENEAWF